VSHSPGSGLYRATCSRWLHRRSEANSCRCRSSTQCHRCCRWRTLLDRRPASSKRMIPSMSASRSVGHSKDSAQTSSASRHSERSKRSPATSPASCSKADRNRVPHSPTRQSGDRASARCCRWSFRVRRTRSIDYVNRRRFAAMITKNCDRLLEAAVAKEFLAQVVGQAWEAGLSADKHFTVDGTLLETWATLKSFQPKDRQDGPQSGDTGDQTVGFHGHK
jgi:hypothetical protein